MKHIKVSDAATGLALESAWGAMPLVPSPERRDAERLLEICAEFWGSDAAGAAPDAREIARLVEVLARRSSQAMPFAALGRALLADMSGDQGQRGRLLDEFQIKLSQIGL